MVEKHLVVDKIRFNYSGMFDINEFFKELDNWTNTNGFERETKKKLEYVEPKGRKMDYIFAIWKQVSDYSKIEIVFRALFQDVVEFQMERNDYHREMQKGRCLVIIDGWLETDIQHRWQQKPIYVFLRTLYDKLVWKFWLGRYDGQIAASCKGLFDTMFAFFKRYKY